MNEQEIEKIYALSPLQGGMLFHALHAETSDQYCVQIEWTYEGNLDPAALKAAWQGVIDHHEILRTRFAWEELSKPVQIVVRKVKVPWFSTDFSTLDKTTQTKRLQQYLSKDRFAGFDLSQPCAMRLHLIKLSEDQYHFIFTNHHIILDGWSLPLLLDELMQRYAAIRQGISPVISPVPPYERYITWIRDQPKQAIAQFWKQQLSTVESATDLRIEKQDIVLDPHKPIEHLESVQYAFDPEQTAQIIAFAKQQNTTVSSVTQLAWATMLSRYSGEERVIYGSVLSGRSHALFGIEKMVGLLINTLPIVIEFNARESLASHLQQVHRAVQEANHYSYIPLTEMQKYSAVPAGHPLFTTLFVFENYPMGGQTAVRDLQMCDVRGHEKTNYPLTVVAYIQEEELQIKINYDNDCFERQGIENLLSQMTHFIMQATADAQQPIRKVEILTLRERQQILVNWNATSAEYPQEKTMHQLFEDQVEKTPEQIALVYEGQQLTYRELNTKANQLARLIQEKYQEQHKKALKPDTLIGLCVERSLDMMVGILGILKAGAAYEPLDPHYPQDRLEYMIVDSHEGLIITQQAIIKHTRFLEKLHHKELLVIDSEEVKSALENQRADNVPPISGPRDLAYVIYTSGSTGRPKGVAVMHQGVNNLIADAAKQFTVNEKSRFLSLTSMSFDIFVLEYALPLFYGATCILCSEQDKQDPERLVDLWDLHQPTIIQATPSLWELLVKHLSNTNTSSHSVFITGGERLTKALKNQLLVLSNHVWNAYGPTETTIWSTYSRCQRDQTVNIGKPFANTQVYVVDSFFNLCPVGVSGELYIGGVGLARGYLNQEALTEERFILNPFAKELGLPKTDRLYKTGDLVRWLPNGNLEYLGRTDFQVKIRGFRIELGEIENVLTQHEALSQAAVLAIEADNNKYLAAYYVLAKGKIAPSIEELKAYLAKRLPDYMIPTAFVLLEKMPLTPSGKVNRNALPPPDLAALAEIYVAPRTIIERQLADIWCQILNVEKIGVHDNFFYLGGHSLLVMQLISRIHAQLHTRVPITKVFEKPSLIELAAWIEKQLSAGKREVYVPIPVTKRLPAGNPLSFAQERLWFLDQFEEASAAYNIPLVFELSGVLNKKALQHSIEQVVTRHESLRTVFVKNTEGVGVQKVLGTLHVPLTVEQIKSDALASAIYEEVHRPFDLTKGPLLRVRLFKFTKNKYILLLNHHHIISDGWSVEILLKELSVFYQAALEDVKSQLTDLPIQYIDFVAWQRASSKEAAFQEKLKYWEHHLADYSDLPLATDKPRPSHFSYRGAHYPFQLDETLSARLKELAQQQGTTLFSVLLTGFSIFLSRYSGTEDVILGTPIANRYHQDVEGLIGFFVNTLILRNEISGSSRVDTLLKKVSQHLLEAFQRQEVPFEHIVDRLGVERDPSRNPIIQVLFVFQMEETSTLELPGVSVKPYPEVTYDVAKFDLTLALEESPSGLRGSFEYCTDLFHVETIERMARHLERLLTAMVSNPKHKVKSLRLLTDERRKQILVDWNATKAEYPREKAVYQLFEEQVEKTPEQTAVVYEDQQLTYQALNAKANQLARLIQEKYQQQHKKALKPDTLIGLCVERSLDMLVGILGILKAGAAYVPLDPNYPEDRLDYMLADSHEGLIVTQEAIVKRARFLKKLHPDELLVLDSVEVKKALKQQHDDNVLSRNGPRDLVYVIYTSGSTGRPKGVMIEHRSLTNCICFQKTFYACREKTRILQFAPISFDVAVSDIFVSLVSGSILYIVTERTKQDESQFLGYLEHHAIEMAQLPPAFLAVLPPVSLPSLHTLIVTGDRCDLAVMKRWSKNRRLINGYGPTESNFVTMHEYREGDSATNIGRALPNFQLYVLDQYLNPCPVGVPGELYIGGVGLARGYLNQKGLTKERFIRNPFAQELGLRDTDRLYKTGDVVRWLPDGNLEYLGRMDFQVKIRGFRIELGEIENVLTQHEAISQTTVVAIEEAGNKYLAAYYVLAKGRKTAPSVEELKAHLAKYLPDYMIPTVFVLLEKMPLTPSGKIHRKALPPPDLTALAETYVAPRTVVEKQLARIWGELLHIEKIGIHDNFFYLGGHSLLVMQLVSHIHAQLHCRVPIKKVFEKPRLVDLAAWIEEELSRGKREAYVPIPVTKRLPSGNPLSFAQERLWFLDQFEGVSAYYNIPLVFELTGVFNRAALQKSLQQLVARHESLRTVFVKNQDGVGMQKVLETLKILPFTVETIESTASLASALHEEVHKPFDLTQGPLLRVRLFKLTKNKYILLLNHHHIISDGWSVGILLKELSVLYQAALEGIKPQLADLPIQYVDFAAWQRASSKDAAFQTKLEYWAHHLADYSDLPLAIDKPRPSHFSYRGAHYSFQLDKALTARLSELAQRQGTTLFAVLLTGFSIFLSRYSGTEDVILGTPIANRYHHDVEGLIGFFVNTLVLRNTVHGDITVETLLKKISQHLLEAFQSQEIPFERIVERLAVERDPSRNPIIQVMFVFQTEKTSAGLELPGVDVKAYPVVSDVAKFDLTLALEESASGLKGSFLYCTDLFRAETIERMARHFERLLTSLVSSPKQYVKSLRLLTDERRKQILADWNATTVEYPHEKTVYQLFEEQVEKTPEQTAVVYEAQHLTYRELNAKANQLARLIEKKYQEQHKEALEADTLIGLYVERSLDMVVGILGILKAGAAYVPLDPNYPEDRLEYMITDSHEGLILTQKAIVKRAKFLKKLHPKELLILDDVEVKKALAKQRNDNVSPLNGPQDLVYVIYTSGSTGRPKGVMIEHRSLTNSIYFQKQLFVGIEKIRSLQFASLSFDAAVFDIFVSLISGGTLYIVTELAKREEGAFLEYLEQYAIQIALLPPALLSVLPTVPLPALHTLIVGGDRCDLATLKRWSKDRRLINAYGPTESTISATTHDYREGDSATNIGKAISNVRLYVLDKHLTPCPVNVPGELYIGGVGLARGYLNQPALTEKRFIHNPFAEELGLPKTDRLYKSGDLVRWLPDGNLEYLGRTDFQVKIRGFRIELGEIENVITQHEAISQATVLAIEEAGNKYLAAYYVLVKEKVAPSVEELKAHLAKRLPDYMIPTVFLPLEKMPLTPSGKVNRKALPHPDLTTLTETYVAPRTAVEKQLARIWGELLHIEKIGIHDNFFYLGGHSLLVIQLMSKINKLFNLDLSISWAFQYRTVIEQAKSIAEAREKLSVYQPIFKLKEQGDNPILFLVHPGESGAEAYQKMAQLFANYQPVYGINSYNLDHLDSPIYDMKLLAAKYIQYMQEIQPKGPYFLGGWSLGGTIAYEIAQQMIGRGEIISGLYLLDTKALTPAKWYEIFKLFPDKMTIQQLRLNNIHEEAAIEKFLKIRSIETELLRRYHLTNLKGTNVILMQALNSVETSDMTLNEYYRKIHKLADLPENGWSPYIENLRVYQFNADHQSIMTGKYLERVVKIIQRDIIQKKLKNNV